MTATIITVPDAGDRDDREFERTGTTDYTRAVEEAGELWAEGSRQERSAAWVDRVEAFGVAASRVLRDRPELAGEILILQGGALHLDFGIVAGMLRAVADQPTPRAAYQGKVGGSALSLPANCN